MFTASLLRSALRRHRSGAQFAAHAAPFAPRTAAAAPAATPDWAAPDWDDRLPPDASAKAAAAVLRRRLTALGAHRPAALTPILSRATEGDDVASILDTVSAWRAAAVARGQAGVLPAAAAAAVVAAAKTAGGAPGAAAALARSRELGLSSLGAGSYARVARALASAGDADGASAVLRSAVAAGIAPTPSLAAAVAYAVGKAGDGGAAAQLAAALEGNCVRVSGSARRAMERAERGVAGEEEEGKAEGGEAPEDPEKA